MKNRLIFSLFLSVFLTLVTSQLALASDQSALYNNYVYPKAAYKQGIKPPFSVADAGTENIDPATGDLSYQVTDLTLKGKNGLDLTLKRFYSSTQSNIYEPYTYYDYGTRYAFAVYRTSRYLYRNSEIPDKVLSESTEDRFFVTKSEADAEIQKFKDLKYNTYYGPFKDEKGEYDFAVLYSVIKEVDSISTYVQYDGYKTLTANEKVYNMGNGWAFDFPYIEKRDTFEYLHYGSAGVFNVDFTSKGGDAHLENYKFKDLVLQKDSTYTNGQTFSKYCLAEKSGKKTYFNSNGCLIGIKDKFDNEIKFEYEMIQMNDFYSKTNKTTATSYPLISKITDSVGRVVNFTYASNKVTVNINDLTDSTNNRTITYNKSAISGLDNEYVLDNVVGADNTTTSYTYEHSSAKFSFTNRTPNSGFTNYYELLKEVKYPTGGKTKYSFAQSTKNCGNDGTMSFYKATERADFRKDERRFNYKKYTYKYENTGEYDGYPSTLAAVPDTYTVKTQVEDENKYGTIYTYSYIKNPTDPADKNLLLTDSLTRDGSTPDSRTTREYDPTTKEVKKVVNISYSGSQSLSRTENYEYDLYRNMTGYWDAQAKGDTTGTEHKTIFTYDTAHFNILTGKTYKRDADTTIMEEYILTPDYKSVATGNIYERKGTAEKVLQARTGYSYDLSGNVSEEKQYIKKIRSDGTEDWDTQYIQTLYDYSDTNAQGNRDFTGLYLTGKYTTGIKDVAGNLVAAKQGDDAGKVGETYKYNWFGDVIEKQDGEGNITTFEYDKLGRQTKQTSQDGSVKTNEYVTNATENYVINTDENSNSSEYSSYGNKTKVIYDELGNLIKEQIYTKNASGVYEYSDINQYEYDSNSRLQWVLNKINGAKTSYVSYNDGRLQKKEVTDTINNNKILSSESYVYEDAVENGTYSKISKTVLGDSTAPSVTTNTYVNIIGKVEKQEAMHNGSPYTDTFKYDYVGNKVEEKTARAYNEGFSQPWTTKYEYNFASKPVKVTNIEGNYTTTKYDTAGRVESVTDFKGNKASVPYSTTYTYDNLNRVIQEQIPFESSGGNIYYTTKKHFYDRNNNVTEELTSKTKAGQAEDYDRTDYKYDNRNRLVELITYDKGAPANYTQYFYDANGNKLRQYTGLSSPLDIYGLDMAMPNDDTSYSVTKYEYDQLGKLTKMTDPLEKCETYVNDLNGNLIQKTDRNGSTITMTYDGMNRLTTNSVTNTDNPAINVSLSYKYSVAGAKANMTGNDGVVSSYTYDDLGRLVNESTGNITKDYTYDAANNRKSMVIKQNGTVKTNTTYTYDNMNRLYQVFENGVLAATYAYDENGNRKSLTNSNGNTTDYSYNLANKLNEMTNKKGTTAVSKYTYSYYLNGNQASKTDLAGKATNYVYDGLGRLSSEAPSGEPTISYTYDDSNNRATMTVAGVSSTAYAYDKNNRLLTEAKTVGITTETTNYIYDDNGNQISKTTETLKPTDAVATESLEISTTDSGITLNEYNGFNQLVKTISDTTTATYTYNADGLRTSKTVNGTVTNHIWDGDQIALETDSTGNVTNEYVRGINLLYAENTAGTKQYYLFNGHGDVVQLTGTDGNVTKSYDYDAFGNEKNPDANDTNVFRYCGEYFDKETGTIYLRARYYDPQVGRFITEDSYWGNDTDPLSLNLYTYCGNAPITFSDPNGHEYGRIGGYVNDYGGNITYGYDVVSWNATLYNKNSDALRSWKTNDRNEDILISKGYYIKYTEAEIRSYAKVTMGMFGCYSSKFYYDGNYSNGNKAEYRFENRHLYMDRDKFLDQMGIPHTFKTETYTLTEEEATRDYLIRNGIFSMALGEIGVAFKISEVNIVRGIAAVGGVASGVGLEKYVAGTYTVNTIKLRNCGISPVKTVEVKGPNGIYKLIRDFSKHAPL